MTIALTRNSISISEFVFSVGVIRTFSAYFSELIGRIQQQNGILAFLTNIHNMLSYPEAEARYYAWNLIGVFMEFVNVLHS